MKQDIFKYFIILVIVFMGCREEIVPPANSAGEVNEQVQYSTRSTYTYIVNAENFSTNFVDHTNLNSSANRIYFYISDYGSGRVELSLINQYGDIFYSERLENNIDGSHIDLHDHLASIIQIDCYDFSGKLKIQLSSL